MGLSSPRLVSEAPVSSPPIGFLPALAAGYGLRRSPRPSPGGRVRAVPALGGTHAARPV